MQTTAAPLSPVLPSVAPARGKPASAAAQPADTTDTRLPGGAFNAQLEQAQTRRDAGSGAATGIAGDDSPKSGVAAVDPLQAGVTEGAAGDAAVDADPSVSGDAPTTILEPALVVQPLAVPVTIPGDVAVAVDMPAVTEAVSAAVVPAAGNGSNLQGAVATTDASTWIDTLEQARRMAAGLPASTGELFNGEVNTPARPALTLDASVLAAQGAMAGRAIQEPIGGKVRSAALAESLDANGTLSDEGGEAFAQLTGVLQQPAAARQGGRQQPAATASQNLPVAARPASPQGDAMSAPAETARGVAAVAGDAAGGVPGSAPAAITPSVTAASSPIATTPAPAADVLQYPGAVQILDEAALPYQLHHHLRWMQTRGQGTAELQLNPAELGPVHVTVKMEERRVEASFLCAQPLTRDLIEAAMPRLREAMESAGMELAGGFVGTGEFGQTSNPAGSEAARTPSRSTVRGDAPGLPIAGTDTQSVRISSHEGLVDTFA